jgi:chromosome segregation ATPase
MPDSPNTLGRNDKLIELGFKVLSTLIVPLAVYLFNLNTEVKLMGQTIESHQEKIREHQTNIEKLKSEVSELKRTLDLSAQEIKHIKEQTTLQSTMVREVYEYILRQQGRTP